MTVTSPNSPDPKPEFAELLSALLAHFAVTVAAQVVAQLRAAELEGYLDQAESPLGRRRHINAIRSGELRGNRVGRRYLATKEDIDQYLRATREKERSRPTGDSVDALAAELGLARR